MKYFNVEVVRLLESLENVLYATKDLGIPEYKYGDEGIDYSINMKILRTPKFIPMFKSTFDPKNVLPPV